MKIYLVTMHDVFGWSLEGLFDSREKARGYAVERAKCLLDCNGGDISVDESPLETRYRMTKTNSFIRVAEREVK